MTGWGIFYWLVPIEIYLLLPVLDEWIGDDSYNPDTDSIRELERSRYYRLIPLFSAPLFLVGMGVSVWYWANNDLHWLDSLGIILSLGFSNALAINTAHELGHKNTVLEKWGAKFLLSLPLYGHFLVEHNRGHHRHVATPEDSASAKMGEGLYRFMLREMIGGVSRACRMESERLRRKRLFVWGLRNECMQSWLLSLILYLSLIAWLGLGVLIILIAQAFFAWFQLSIANYIEHYGLLRQKDENGQYLSCRPEHSWNSNRLLSGLVLLNLPRHSDHHANAGRRYQSLRSDPDAPLLPGGYPLMFILAMVPPLWRRIMDPCLMQHYGQDPRRINRLQQSGAQT
ncbi:MAG: alkane 1-monooxygenase [Gammaproteobacteria bacterium]|nr:alkane 1-monooxygenase [Gammaproteobacteria bacterium]